MLQGRKTYLAAALVAVAGILQNQGILEEWLASGQGEGTLTALAAGGLAALRAGVQKGTTLIARLRRDVLALRSTVALFRQELARMRELLENVQLDDELEIFAPVGTARAEDVVEGEVLEEAAA